MTRQEVAMRRRIENAQKMQDRAQEKIEREYMTDLEITRLCTEAMGIEAYAAGYEGTNL